MEEYHESATYQKGIACMDEKKFIEAIHYFNKIIFLFPTEAELYMHRGEAFLKCLDINSAISNFKKAISLLEEQDVIVALRERLAILLDAQGCLSFNTGQYSKAHQYFSDAMAYWNESSILQYHRGLTNLKMGFIETAITDITPCHDKALARPFSSVGLILAYLRKFALKEANQILIIVKTGNSEVKLTSNVEVLFSKYCETLQTRGVTLTAAGKFEAAIKLFTELLQLNPNTAELYRLKSFCYCGLRKYSEAVQELLDGMAKTGEHTSAQKAEKLQLAEMLVKVAEEHIQQGDYKKATDFLSEGIKWVDNISSWYLRRGECWEKLSLKQNAMEDYQRAIELDPSDKSAKRHLGYLYDDQGIGFFNEDNIEKAFEEFSNAIDIADDVPIFYYHRCRCRLHYSNSDTLAIRDLMKCMELGTSNVEIIKLAQQMNITDSVEPKNKQQSCHHRTSATVCDAEGKAKYKICDEFSDKRESKLKSSARPSTTKGYPTVIKDMSRNELQRPKTTTFINNSAQASSIHLLNQFLGHLRDKRNFGLESSSMKLLRCKQSGKNATTIWKSSCIPSSSSGGMTLPIDANETVVYCKAAVANSSVVHSSSGDQRSRTLKPPQLSIRELRNKSYKS